MKTFVLLALLLRAEGYEEAFVIDYELSEYECRTAMEALRPVIIPDARMECEEE